VARTIVIDPDLALRVDGHGQALSRVSRGRRSVVWFWKCRCRRASANYFFQLIEFSCEPIDLHAGW